VELLPSGDLEVITWHAMRLNAVALKKLRSVKERDGKPFAIMFKNIAIARKYAQISEVEEEALLSWQRPIVLVKSQIRFPSELANHLTTLGIFLPYLPFHFQLF
jgi:hydrogenase maturation protein HypF